VSPLYDWRPASTYIRRPPYWEGALAGERTLAGLRPLAVLGDNITTDHIMPAGADILPFRSNIPEMAKHVFEKMNLLADRRLSEPQLGAGAGEASLARHEPEVEQVMVVDPFHGIQCTSLWSKRQRQIFYLSKYNRRPIVSGT
jgi:aconitase A